MERIADQFADVQYSFCPWGDLIYGSKEALQAMGLGVGLAFPGEDGGPRRSLRCADPRGFECTIEHGDADGRFSAKIPFPGRSYPHPSPREFAPGVTLRTGGWAADIYEGTGDALVAAGLVRTEHLPGAPGVGKTVVYLDLAGSITDNAGWKTDREGAVCIRKTSGRRFSVAVLVSMDEVERRAAVDRATRADYEQRMAKLPRPAPLVLQIPERSQAAKERRQQMRLVWSRLAPSFSLDGFGPTAL